MKGRTPKTPATQNQSLAALLQLLQARAVELCWKEPQLPYQTVYSLLHRVKNPSLRTAALVVGALRALAKDRAEHGLPHVPPESITADVVFPAHRRAA